MNTSGLVKAILGDTRGATAVEYGLIVALIVIAIITSLKSVANENTGLWAVVNTAVTSVM
jgi:pilus assembly protein Flp/PilA